MDSSAGTDDAVGGEGYVSIPSTWIILITMIVLVIIVIIFAVWLAKYLKDKQYSSIMKVQKCLRDAGLSSCNLIIAIDYTKSNEKTGAKTFGGKCLHTLEKGVPNPYQRVIQYIGETLSAFDEDGLIDAFGFGDAITRDKGVFPFVLDRQCKGFKEVLFRYQRICRKVTLGGPTSFVAPVEEAIRIVEERGTYHILVIVADGTDGGRGSGQYWKEQETMEAIIKASHYPLSIVMVGVGDGPFGLMNSLDDLLPKRAFDNFQFVDFSGTIEGVRYPGPAFALEALEEIPQQSMDIRRLGLLQKVKERKREREGVLPTKSSLKKTARASPALPPSSPPLSHPPSYAQRAQQHYQHRYDADNHDMEEEEGEEEEEDGMEGRGGRQYDMLLAERDGVSMTRPAVGRGVTRPRVRMQVGGGMGEGRGGDVNDNNGGDDEAVLAALEMIGGERKRGGGGARVHPALR
mmetsp:Transcript_10460/g.27402  ORF Transcript_10460/g.27402 Transcript_10460/m.27402 type:complete len:461 (-) Transcript_10460:143-1525(-)